MTNELRLMLVLAHPDDESLGNGGMVARYAAEGVETYLVTATRGEQGWFGPEYENPGPEELGRIREAELLEAAEVLGLREVSFLDYRDGELDQAPADEVVRKIVWHIRRVKPGVVVTFDQNGLYGHPDHIAICRHATAAVAAASDPSFSHQDGQPSHHVSKLYYMAWTQEDVELYESAFGELTMQVNGHRRSSAPWQEWAVTTRIDATAHWRRAWDAITRHRTQLPSYQKLAALPEETHERLWGRPLYYRVFSRMSVRQGMEDDLFEGLRERRGQPAHQAPVLVASHAAPVSSQTAGERYSEAMAVKR
jgi:LmbE family N-acetylglucosaminyl deacetylase